MTILTRRPQTHRRNGWMLIELMISIGLLVGLGISTTTFLHRCGSLNGHLHARMRCLAAAEAQLDCLAARGEPLPAAEVERFWPDVEISVDRQEGQGDWTGMTLLSVEATTTVRGRRVEVQLRRYVGSTGAEGP